MTDASFDEGRSEILLTKLIDEVLNGNLLSIESLLSQLSSDVVNACGHCGETAGHIAIYQNDAHLLRLLLDAGAHPNTWNANGNSLIHTAVLLGYVDLLTLLYETQLCDLTLTNRRGQTALELAASSFQESDLVAASLFLNSSFGGSGIDGMSDDHGKESVKDALSRGRQACHVFLTEKLSLDQAGRISRAIEETAAYLTRRDRLRRLMTDTSHKVEVSAYQGRLSHPTELGKEKMSLEDQEEFTRFKAAVNRTVTKQFSHEIVMNAIFMNR